MSADDGIIINRKNLTALHWQGEGEGKIIATAKNIDELLDKVQEYSDDIGGTEYGINLLK